jgi:hypothetical protein
MKKLFIILVLIISAHLIIKARYVNRWVIMENSSPSHEVKVFGFTSDLVGSWGAELVVYDKRGKDVIKRVLLVDKRDIPEELTMEFHGVSIQDRTVRLFGEFNHYKGGGTIDF